LKLFDTKTAQVLFTILVFVTVLLFFYAAWRAVIAFLFAIFFAYLLEAPVNRLERWLRGSRMAAIAVVYLVLVVGITLLFVFAGPPIAREAQTLMQQAPKWASEISSGEIVQNVGSHHGWSEETQDRIQQFLLSHRQDAITATQNLALRAVKTVQNVWWLLLVPILAIFFLKDGRKFGDMIINSVRDKRNRQLVSDTMDEMNQMLGGFIRSQLLLAALAMVVITVVISLMGVPYAFAVGPAAGALEFIPVVGPIIGIALILGVGFFSGYHHLLAVLLFLLVWRGIQDYISSPRILGRQLALHPLLVLFGVFAGGEVAGVIGVFLSIPVLASLRILWHTMQLLRKASTHPRAPA
jgi:predicted PurR-regulated permease PerM